MKLFGKTLFEGGNEIKKQLARVTSQLAELRPDLSSLGDGNAQNVYIPHFPQQNLKLYEIAFYSDVLKNVLISLRREIFRRGIDLKPKFVKRCDKCEKDYQSNVELCEICNEATRSPDESQKKRIYKLIDRANENNQTLLEVCETVEDDINIMDDGWLALFKDYTFNGSEELVGGEMKEIVRLNSAYTDFLSDGAGNLGRTKDGNPAYVCVAHRNKLLTNKKPCPICGLPVFPAFYVYKGTKKDYTYYIEGEVLHKSKYSPSILRGFPPTLAIWQKVMTLMYQDKYIMQMYGKQRPPKGMLLVNSSNQPALEKAWAWLLEKARKNPHVIHPLGITSNSSRGQVGQFINFMNNLQEMQYTEGRDEIRRQIGALYGVSPIFQSDMSQSGGLNNEGLQITVTNRTVEAGQRVYNEGFFPQILKQLSITDWEMVLLPSEERDEMAELQREAQMIQNAMNMRSMGFDIKLKEDQSFEYSGDAKPVEETQENTGWNFRDASSLGGSPAPFQKRDLTPDTDLGNKIKKKIEEFAKSPELKKKDKKSIINSANRLAKEIVKEIKALTNKTISSTYDQVVQEVEKELDMNFVFGRIDNETIKTLQESNVLSDAFSGLEDKLVEKVQEAIKSSITKEGFDLSKLSKNIQEEADLTKARADLIARTETTKVANAARINSYKKSGEDLKFKWIGPTDRRTSKVCKNIKKRTEKGVSMEELIKIVQEESKKEFPEWVVDENSPVAHPNCRHVLVRKF